MLDYLMTNKEWIFDGWGAEAIGLLIAAVAAVGTWLYKRFRSSPNPPQPISLVHPIEVQLLPPKKEEQPPAEPDSEVAGIVKRFNMVLTLMNQRRTYNKYTIAKLARIMQLNSVSDLEDIFLGKHEASFDFIDKFCNCFGVYKEWLINAEITPFFSGYGWHSNPLHYLDEIILSKPERIFFVRCDSPVGETIIVVKFSNWKYKQLGDMWPISDQVGATGAVKIFDMYCLIMALENRGRYCSGRILNKEDFGKLNSGYILPWSVLESPNCYENYWCHDFTDVYHNSWAGRSQSWISDHYEELYGKGFLYAQSTVRWKLEGHEKQKAASPLLHTPQYCTTCCALYGKEDDHILSATQTNKEYYDKSAT